MSTVGRPKMNYTLPPMAKFTKRDKLKQETFQSLPFDWMRFYWMRRFEKLPTDLAVRCMANEANRDKNVLRLRRLGRD